MPALLAALAIMQTHSFTVKGEHFMLDGKPFVVRSGEIHYPRIPHQYWRSRLKMARAMGLNTICTYVFWNLHESKPGKWDFTGDLDLGNFIKIAGEEGLKVIVRPGPYVCTELDFGGFPAWLLKDRSMTVRTKDPKFLSYTESYMKQIGRIVKPYLIGNGGPVIMAQVENEYGSYGSDHEYMGAIRDMMKRTGFECLLFTSDGPGQGMLNGGTLPDLPSVINFGGGAPAAFEEFAKFRKGVPRMIGEFWAGWFDHWGKGHHTSNLNGNLTDLKWCLDNDVSFNLYMFHGGTNFGFMQGSNGGANDYNVDTTSYDYDSALNESGRVTPKFLAFREAILTKTKEDVPPIPDMAPTITIPPIELMRGEPLLGFSATGNVSEKPKTFEDLDQAHGMVLYSKKIDTGGELVIDRLMDYAIVYIDGVRIGVLDRRRQEKAINLPRGGKLDILVESLSRVNFGGLIPRERKGIDGKVMLDGKELTGWAHQGYPLESLSPWEAMSMIPPRRGPYRYQATFEVTTPGDTFLDMRNFTKGFVWVNGRNLGRFWRIGPQQTLFLPGVWLKPGSNQIVVLDEADNVEKRVIEGLNYPILNEAMIDHKGLHRDKDEKLDLSGLSPIATGTLPGGPGMKTVSVVAEGRYLCLQALNEHVSGGPFTSLAEIYAVDAAGKDISREKWKIAYADSEEIDNENGSAANAIDQQPTTMWHTRWGDSQPPHPHEIVIDLGAVIKLSAVKLLPRGEGPNGRIKDYRIYVSSTLFKGLKQR